MRRDATTAPVALLLACGVAGAANAFSGGSGGARTHDQRLKRALLYRLSYRPVGGEIIASRRARPRFRAPCLQPLPASVVQKRRMRRAASASWASSTANEARTQPAVSRPNTEPSSTETPSAR
jgi:hypothetical protein